MYTHSFKNTRLCPVCHYLYIVQWCQRGHKLLTPWIIAHHVCDKSYRSWVDFLQTGQSFDYHSAEDQTNRNTNSKDDKNKHHIKIQDLPNDVKVGTFWWVQVEKWGHIVRRINSGYVPRHYVKSVKGKSNWISTEMQQAILNLSSHLQS